MKQTIYLFFLLLFTGCHYLDDYSQHLVVVKTPADLDEVLLGSGYLNALSKVNNITGGSVCWWLHVLDDDVDLAVAKEARVGSNAEVDNTLFGYTTWQAEVGRGRKGNNLADDNGSWNNLYQHINAVNIILNEMKEMDLQSPEDEATALRVEGECRFLRAQFYLLLVNVYANAYDPATAATTLGVPLKLTHYVEYDKDKDTQFDRTPVADVYRQIVEDLKRSVECLTESPQLHPAYRASREAALLLLSRVYLYMQDWENARKTANDLLSINNVLTNLGGVLKDSARAVLTSDNPEILFTQGVLNVQKSFSGRGGDMCFTEELYNLYDSLDWRKSLYFNRSYESGELAQYRKYDTGDEITEMSDLFLLRTAEAYLNMAEACAMLGNAAEASDWLNRLRRFRIENYQDVAYNANDIIEQVRLERRKELCLEGHRWFDLRRYAVCQKAPFKKVIRRKFACYNWDYKALLMYVQIYELQENDPAYTFAIPKKVLEFDQGMPDNPRETRTYSEIIYNEEE